MKRLLCLISAFLLITGLAACAAGSIETAAPAGTQPTTASTTASTASQTLSANAPVVFADSAFEAKVRKMMNKPDGDILAGECAALKDLYIANSDYPKDQWDSIPEEVKVHSLADLEYFPNVGRIEMGQNAVSDLSPLAACTQLTYLDAPMNKITDISALAGLTNLVYAVFWENQISDISAVASLTKLETFSVFSNQVSDISALAGLKNLTILELRDNPIADFSPVAAIYDQISEKDFNLDAPVDEAVIFTDPVLELMVRKSLNIPEGDITRDMAGQVQELDLANEWQQTYAPGTQITDIGALSHFKNLFKLSLAFHAVSDLRPLGEMKNLGILDLNGNPIYDLKPLAGCENLMALNLSGIPVADLSPLADLAKLHDLNLAYSQITDIGALAGFSNLKTLNLESAHVQDYTPLAKLNNLTALFVCLPDEKYTPDYSPLKNIYPNLVEKNFTLD